WNGKYYQLPKVNLWPRPLQDPHPPLLVPGAASSSTWDYCHDRNLPYAYLSYFGGQIGLQRVGPLLGARRRQGQGCKSLSRVVPAACRRGGDRPQGGSGVRQARRIFLSQAPAPTDLSDRATRI